LCNYFSFCSSDAANTAKTSEADLFGPNLMDDFIDEPAATPATKGVVEPQVDLFGDADFQSATPSAEIAAHQDVQVWFSAFSIYLGC
jgi:epsin